MNNMDIRIRVNSILIMKKMKIMKEEEIRHLEEEEDPVVVDLEEEEIKEVAIIIRRI